MMYSFVTTGGSTELLDLGYATLTRKSSSTGGERRAFLATSDLSIIFARDDRPSFIADSDLSIKGVNP